LVAIVLFVTCQKEIKNALPTVVTDNISSISNTSALVNSEITSDGGANIVARGICWNTSTNPTINNSKTIDSVLTGKITSKLTGLTKNQKYYVRAYAINNVGIAYGEEKSFSTDSVNLPTLSIFTETQTVGYYGSNVPPIFFGRVINAKLSGTILSTGNSVILSKGICWGRKANTSIANTIIKDTTSGTTISVTIPHLAIDSIFYARAFATNETGTVYSNEITINTSYVDTGGQVVVFKPNVYIYPKVTSQLQVSLSFPQGGSVIKSIPEYNTGWNVTVEPSGLIDNKYSFLFYESTQLNVWQINKGWILAKADLKAFFIKNMSDYGFKGQEITDYVEYWIPRLNEEYYTIYPQEKAIINSVISLNISQQPENTLRLYYLIKGSKTKPNVQITTPVISSFNRTGYFVTEWGVVL
jgi:hypothetical protein